MFAYSTSTPVADKVWPSTEYSRPASTRPPTKRPTPITYPIATRISGLTKLLSKEYFTKNARPRNSANPPIHANNFTPMNCSQLMDGKLTFGGETAGERSPAGAKSSQGDAGASDGGGAMGGGTAVVSSSSDAGRGTSCGGRSPMGGGNGTAWTGGARGVGTGFGGGAATGGWLVLTPS